MPVFIAPVYNPVFGKLQLKTISGVVLVDNNPASRIVRLYNNNETNILAQTVSDRVTGVFSFSVTANINDNFHVLAIGTAGENDQVFSHIFPQ